MTFFKNKQLDRIEEKLSDIHRAILHLDKNLTKVGNEMAVDLSELATTVGGIQDTVQSAATLIDQIADALEASGGNQEEVDALVASLRSAKDQLAEAVANPGTGEPVDPNDVPHPDQTLPGDLPQG